VLILLGIAFLAGVITAISPCVLPVLPLLLAGSATSSHRSRPFAIIAGLVVSFTAFTLAGAAILSALGLPEDLLRNVAIVALLVLAASLLSRRVAWLLERPFLFLTRRRVSPEGNGVLLGMSVGLVFVPCAGPVLAAVTALAASGEVGARIVFVTGAYALGAALPMLAIVIGGQRLTSAMRLLRTHAEATRRTAGVVLGASALAIAIGVDQRFTTALPGYTEALQERIERSSTARRELRTLKGSEGSPLAADVAQADSGGSSVARAPRAPEFRGIEQWLNTPGGKPISIAGLRGKVVIVDFWTYSCINCLRTLPHLKAWDRAYRKAGLVIVGIHSPEFAFERVPGNVRSAVRRLALRYPVALDNDFATWNAYDNDYWPAKYLVDRSGRVRYTHFGEGAYGETESWIRRLLGEKARTPRTSVADRTPSDITTRESYLGYARLDRFAGHITPDREGTYVFPRRRLVQDELAYAGRWTVTPEHITAGGDARLRLRFQANDIFVVLAGEGRVEAFVDDRPTRRIAVSGTPRLYTVARFSSLQRGLLELRFSPGVEGYAFTFG
jgi:cytochrome c biogenesis protein CcdA/thiol-disulfide isomerase/thioredoxin